ncbi:Protein-lysine methyltransferase [Nymphaea thermarum]|nr:Protein-lysine methyltransferase [Nymphaea thermarum]
MRFTDSPVVEIRVRGHLLTFEQDNGSMHVGTSVWPCSLVLVKFLDRWLSAEGSTAATATTTVTNPYAPLFDFRTKRGVELGAGCGVAGMGLSLLGLDVVLTDIAPVMPALKRNLKRNLPSSSASSRPTAGKLKIAQLYWNNKAQIQALKPPFDFVIATDVVYLEETVEPLLSAMDALAGPATLILLGYQLRSPEAHQKFWELCPTLFSVDEVPHEHLHLDYAYEETDVYILRKRA